MKVDIISGFLGAGKTSFINRYLPLIGGKVALIENEFGDTSIDSQLIEEDIPVKEIFAGCICCTLRGDLATGIKEISDNYQPDRIVIEPSGVGRLSDVIKGVEDARKITDLDLDISRLIVMVDAQTFWDYYENFGPFYLDQIENANLIFLTFVEEVDEEELEEITDKIKELNPHASIFTSDYRDLDDDTLMEVISTASDPIISDKESTRAIPGDKVFSSMEIDTGSLTVDDIEEIFEEISKGDYGYLLRGKGYLPEGGGSLVNYTPGKLNIEDWDKAMEEKLVLIGTDLKEDEIRDVFASRS